MKRDNVNYLMVGVFVVVMGVLFMVLLFAVTGRSGPSDRYYVYYDNVAGLKFGTGVFYEGFRIGQVESITPESGDGGVRYKIEISVAAGWAIPSDSVASVESSGLISAVTIDIKEGQAATALEPGDTLAGRGQADIFSVLNQAAADFRQLSQEGLMPVLNNLNGRITEVADAILAFRRDELSPFVSMLHQRIDQDVIADALKLLDDLGQSARHLQTILGEGNQQRITSFLTHIDDVAVNLNELIDRIEATRKQMNGVLQALGELVTENEGEVSATVNSAQNSLQELEVALKTVNQHLATILYNLEGGSRHMNEFARSIRDNPARLIRNSTTTEPGSQ